MSNPSKKKGVSGPAPTPVEERLARRLLMSPSGCLEFQGALKDGYGKIVVGSRSDGSRRLKFAHRVAWELANGPIPDGLIVCHACDNRLCCNPEHLFLGTHNDNMADMVAKGRQRNGRPAGVLNGRAKLSPSAAAQIRERYAAGESRASLAEAFGVGRSAIREVVTGMRWVA